MPMTAAGRLNLPEKSHLLGLLGEEKDSVKKGTLENPTSAWGCLCGAGGWCCWAVSETQPPVSWGSRLQAWP